MTVRIVFLDRGTFPPDLSLCRPSFPHQLVEYDRTDDCQVQERIANANVVITNKVPLREEDIATAKALKFIAVAATGADIVDVEACRASGIAVSNVRGYAQNSVAEHVFALIFALKRQIISYSRSIADGAWQKSGQFCYFGHPIDELRGTTLGIIGAGAIGRAVGCIGSALGMTVLFAARKGQKKVNVSHMPFERVDCSIATSSACTHH